MDPEPRGRILVEDIAALIDARTRVVTLSAVQFSNGFRQDLQRTADLCQTAESCLNLDGIQLVGALTWTSRSARRLPVGRRAQVAPRTHRNRLLLLPPRRAGSSPAAEHRLSQRREGRGPPRLRPGLSPRCRPLRGGAGQLPGALGPGGRGGHDRRARPAADRAHVSARRSADRGVLARGYTMVSSRHRDERSAIVSFRHPARASEEVHARLQAARVDVALCVGALRASPSVHNDAADVQALLDALP